MYCSPANARGRAFRAAPHCCGRASQTKRLRIQMMNTIFALSMVAGVGLTTGTPVIGARVAEEMWAAGRADTARSRTCEVAYQTARRAVPAPSYLNRKKTAAGERPAKKKKGREYDRGDRREAIRMYLADEKVVDIAAAYGTHERTVYKWLKVSHFPSRIRLRCLCLLDKGPNT